MSAPRLTPEIVAGLLTGLTREMARQLEVPVSVTLCRHAAWYVAVGGFGLSYEQIGRAMAPAISKQAVGEACSRIADRCEDRKFERHVQHVADVFGVSL